MRSNAIDGASVVGCLFLIVRGHLGGKARPCKAGTFEIANRLVKSSKPRGITETTLTETSEKRTRGVYQRPRCHNPQVVVLRPFETYSVAPVSLARHQFLSPRRAGGLISVRTKLASS
jgi:hypothetical protein